MVARDANGVPTIHPLNPIVGSLSALASSHYTHFDLKVEDGDIELVTDLTQFLTRSHNLQSVALNFDYHLDFALPLSPLPMGILPAFSELHITGPARLVCQVAGYFSNNLPKSTTLRARAPSLLPAADWQHIAPSGPFTSFEFRPLEPSSPGSELYDELPGCVSTVEYEDGNARFQLMEEVTVPDSDWPGTVARHRPEIYRVFTKG